MKKELIRYLSAALALLAVLWVPAGQGAPPGPVGVPMAYNFAPLADAGPDFITYVGLASELRGYGSDAEGPILRYEWDFDGDGAFDWQSVKTAVAVYAYPSPGVYRAILRVTDLQGEAATDATEVTVKTGTGEQQVVPVASLPVPAPSVRVQDDGVVKRYAVMINGSNEARFWADVVFMYDTLVDDYHFPPERIYLFNAYGTNPDDVNPDDMIDHPATLVDIEAVFVELATIVDGDDELLVWVTDHGRGYTGPKSRYYGYLDGFVSVQPGDEQDYLERDFKLRSLFTNDNHGMNQIKCLKRQPGGIDYIYRHKYVSTFTDVYFESVGVASDDDIT